MTEKKKPGAYTGYTAARKAANAKYEADSVERISLVLSKGKKAIIKAHATAQGESVNGFINRAISETMERDAGLKATDAHKRPQEGEGSTLSPGRKT